ncbi:MAG: hypothetical protein ACFFAO_17835, partial [Candidatus Hermodarchaeota archaeon]
MTYNKFVIERKLKEFLEEDCNIIDISGVVIPKDAQSSAKIIAKSKGYISGLQELEILYNDLLKVKTIFRKKDGE